MQTLAIQGPFESLSGYGVHARIIARAALATNKWDVKLLCTSWGNTPNTVAVNDLKPYFCSGLAQQPDVSLQVSLPSEFVRIGKRSIGVTAVTETDVCPPEFVIGTDNVDLVLVPSQFSLQVLTGTVLERKDERTGQIVETKKCTKPVKVLFEGIDTNVFSPTKLDKTSEFYRYINQTITDDFCFLFVGHWLEAELGHDRKDVGMLVRVFLEAFRNQKGKCPALILKTSGAGFSHMEVAKIKEKIEAIKNQVKADTYPNVHILNGDLTNVEMNELYNHHKVKAFVTFTKGEGYCLPLAEFMTTGKPIIASNHSGHLDFVKLEHSVLLAGKLDVIHPSAANKWLPKGSRWFTVDYNYAGKVLQRVYTDYPKYKEKCKPSAQFIKNQFSFEKMTTELDNILTEIAPPKFITLNLPKLTQG